MNVRSRWLTTVVSGSAILGGFAALSGTPASSSQTERTLATTTSPTNPTTSEIASLVTQAQRLGAEITSARSELAQLEQTVAARAVRRVAPTTRTVAVSPPVVAPVTHATTGASSSNTDGSEGGGNDN